METLKKIHTYLTAFLVIVLFVQTCSLQRTVRSLNKKVEDMQSKTVKPVTKEELDMMLKDNMYESLILEEDVDKGTISISEIKKKKIENDK